MDSKTVLRENTSTQRLNTMEYPSTQWQNTMEVGKVFREMLDLAWQLREYPAAMEIVIKVEKLARLLGVLDLGEIYEMEDKLSKQTKTKPVKKKIYPKILMTLEWPKGPRGQSGHRKKLTPFAAVENGNICDVFFWDQADDKILMAKYEHPTQAENKTKSKNRKSKPVALPPEEYFPHLKGLEE